jgi:hypothetical protein
MKDQVRTISADELAIKKMLKQANMEELKEIRKDMESMGLRRRAEEKGEY